MKRPLWQFTCLRCPRPLRQHAAGGAGAAGKQLMKVAILWQFNSWMRTIFPNLSEHPCGLLQVLNYDFRVVRSCWWARIYSFTDFFKWIIVLSSQKNREYVAEQHLFLFFFFLNGYLHVSVLLSDLALPLNTGWTIESGRIHKPSSCCLLIHWIEISVWNPRWLLWRYMCKCGATHPAVLFLIHLSLPG